MANPVSSATNALPPGISDVLGSLTDQMTSENILTKAKLIVDQEHMKNSSKGDASSSTVAVVEKIGRDTRVHA